MKKINKKKKGFTLIELVIVLAVLAIIALIAIPNFTKVRNDSMLKSDYRSAEQIEKITLMAIADEDITVAGDIILTFSGQKAPASDLAVGDGKNNYEDMLEEVSKPQMKADTAGKTNGYKVVVKPDMSVEVFYSETVTVDGKAIGTLTK